MKTFEIELSKEQIDKYNKLLAVSFDGIKDGNIMLFSTDTKIKQMHYHIYIGLIGGFNRYWIEYNIIDENGVEDSAIMNDDFMKGVKYIITLSNNESIAIKVKTK